MHPLFSVCLVKEMLDRDSLYESLEKACIKAAPTAMKAEEIRARSQRLNVDIEHFESVCDAFDNQKLSNEILISECVVGIDLLSHYAVRIPSSGPEPIKFFRKEYMTRLQMLTLTLSTLINKVRIGYTPRALPTVGARR